jgi:hypothetical protein
MTEQLPTIQRLPSLREHRRLLSAEADRLFAEKYPQGQFSLLRPYPGDRNRPGLQIFWRWRRAYSIATLRGVGCYSHQAPRENMFGTMQYRPMVLEYEMWVSGRKTHYKTLEKMIKAAEKFDFPADFIRMFVEEYNTKHAEIERERRII